MATFSLFPILTTLFFALASIIEARNTLIQQGGFTLDLIHRDSPLSPLYNPSNAQLEIITNAFRRSISRASSRKAPSSTSGIQSDLYSIPGEYIMKISIGTPPVETHGIADTGSDLTWTQCNPCTNCYRQSTPIFNPNHSYSYKPLSCQSKECSALSGPGSSCTDQNACEYRMTYGDQSFSNGNLSSETFTFCSSTGKHISIENVAFGCGHNNKLTFDGKISGVIGLGGGPLSIVRQLKGTVNGKFSYCLVPIYKGTNVTSKISFGSQAVVEGPGVVSTPLVPKFPDTYYYLTLEGIKVGNKFLSYKSYSNSENQQGGSEGNIIIDSGTTLTMLPTYLYNSLELVLTKAIGAKTTTDPQGVLSLCYKGSADLKFPTIKFRFTGADLDLPGSSTFYEVAEGIVCLAIIPSDGLAILGNLSQADLVVGYDLVNNKVSFKRTDCTKK